MHYVVRTMAGRILVYSIALVVSIASAFGQTDDEMIGTAWQQLQQSNYRKAEVLFQQAIEKNPKNPRGYLGLSYFYSLQRLYAKAWDNYVSALGLVENPYPYMYAVLGTPFVVTDEDADNNIFTLYNNYTKTKPDADGIVRAMLSERLGALREDQGKLDKAKAEYAKTLAIDTWAVIGPFDNPCGSGFNKQYPPETEINMNAVYNGKYNAPAQWFVPPTQRRDRWIDFMRFFAASNGVYYAIVYVNSPSKQKVSCRVGTSGAFKAFLNDEVVLQSDDEFNNDLDTYIAETELQQGWNKVLMKCCHWDIDKCNFMVRFTDNAGNEIPGLQYSTDSHDYRSKPGAPVTVIPSSFEKFFEKQVEAHPDYLENYLLLTDCYLRNDKGEQGEITLKNALKKSPNSVVLLDNIMEAYIRNHKRDEIATTLEKLTSIDTTLLNALEYKFSEALENKNYDEAEHLFKLYELNSPNREQVLSHQIRLLSSKDDPKLQDVIRMAYKAYPYNYTFVSMMSYLEVAQKNYNGSIDIWEKYLDKHYTFDALTTLGLLHLQKRNLEKWEKHYQKAIELANYATGYYYRIASIYKEIEMYDRAEEFAQILLKYCPGSPDYYELLGELARKRGRESEALNYYKESLKRYPGDSKVREIIRELENKKPIWDLFTSFNVDSLIKNSPKADNYPDDNSVALLDDAKFVIYPEGTYEVKRESLVRILKQEGIDRWKEQNLGKYAQIEKAVAIKANGTEVRADNQDGYLVFKTLQEGDFVYIRYKEYYAESGRFLKHFWHREYFQGSSPYKISRLSILAPANYKLGYRSRNMQQAPTQIPTKDGTIYEWRVDDLEAAKRESSMPSWEDVGRYVEVSSVDSWQYIVDWYTEYTNKRTKATYEIKEKMQELFGNNYAKYNEDEIVQKVYRFITDSIRYSSVSFRQSGYIPQKARDVLINKIGDCKDVATLAITMLAEAGIKSDYVLVNTNTSLLTDELPSRSFDHVIVKVNGKTKTRFLDFTASNFPIGNVPSGDVESFALHITPGNTKAMHLERSLFEPNTITHTVDATINDAGDLSAQSTTVYRGELSARVRAVLRTKGKKDREKYMIENLGTTFPNVKLTSFTINNLDTLTPEAILSDKFDSPQYATEVGGFKMLKLPWKTGTDLRESFSYNERKYPIEFDPGYDTATEIMRITVPAGLAPMDLKPEIKQTSSLADYTLTTSFANGVLTAKRTFVIKKRLVETSEYATIKEFYNGIVKIDTQQILLGKAPPPAAPAGKGKKK
ncbi:MAG: tetratricopeptide repeat protein [Candidatus Kapabacteria bacterium]|nr:tetratricopeptide repeat protein [Candidatus Kapabacteria bacterium]